MLHKKRFGLSCENCMKYYYEKGNTKDNVAYID